MQKRLLVLLAFPILLAVPKAGCADTIYVSNHGGDTGHPNTIEQFTSNGVGSVFANTGSLNYPTGLAFDSSGNLFTTIDVQPPAGTGSIVKFTPGGVESVFVSAGLSNPEGLAFDASGNLYVANSYGNTIDKITPGGVVSVFASTGLNYPVSLAFDRSGNLYVTNDASNTIERFTPGGVGSVFASVNSPYGLAFDASGNLFVSSDKTIDEFTPGGVGSIFAETGVNSGDLAFDSSGDLYAILGNTIEEYTPGGVGSVFASAGLSTPAFIAIKPGLSTVPEPRSFVLLALGAAVGFWRWLFKRRANAKGVVPIDDSQQPRSPIFSRRRLDSSGLHPVLRDSAAARQFYHLRPDRRRQAMRVCDKLLKCRVGAGQVRTRRTAPRAPTIGVLPELHGDRHAVNLGTKWEQYWRYQPNAITISG